MIVRKLQPIDTQLRKLQEIPETFFSRIEDCDDFEDETLFPNWISNVFPATALKTKFRAIYVKYKLIADRNERQKIIDAFIHTNEVSKLCCNDELTLHIELNDLEENIREEIDELFLYLYNSALTYPGFTKYVKGDLRKDIKQFTINNSIDICPFCGLESLIQIKGQSRIALDHWLNKDRFPFASINFRNLVPIGEACNGRAVKGTENVLKDKSQVNRIKAYYPYNEYAGIYISFNYINEPSINGITDNDWNLAINPIEETERSEFDSWMYIFNIKERYSSYLRNYPFLRWETNYKAFVNADENDDIEHAETIDEFKLNLRLWKRTFPIKNRHGSIIYRPFIDYLINRASEPYLFSLVENIKRNPY
ncbi:MAG: hypothetical protein R3E32_16320 [Chitinophagales bacterium]